MAERTHPRLPLAIGGVLRCCIHTLDQHETVNGTQEEGTVLPCLYCQSALHVIGGKWQWCGEYPCPHRVPPKGENTDA